MFRYLLKNIRIMIEKGNIVRLEIRGENIYGNVVWIEGENAHVDYYNREIGNYETKPILLTELVKIGSHQKIIKNGQK